MRRLELHGRNRHVLEDQDPSAVGSDRVRGDSCAASVTASRGFERHGPKDISGSHMSQDSAVDVVVWPLPPR